MNKPGSSSRKMVGILGADPHEISAICRLIEAGAYRTRVFGSLAELYRCSSEEWLAVILDIDSLALDNRAIRDLTLNYPAVAFFCTSRERFHPEIKDAICHHLFACLNKPIDADELHYLLKCVSDDGQPPEQPMEYG